MKHKIKTHNRVILKKAISLIAAAIFLSQQVGWAGTECNAYSLRALAVRERNNRTDIVSDNPALLDEAQTRLYRVEFLEKMRAKFKAPRNSRAWTWEQISKIPDAIRALYDAGIDIRAKAMCRDNSIETARVLSKLIDRQNTTGSKLYSIVKKCRIDWDSVLKAAGFNSDEIRGFLKWTPEQEARIPQTIRALYDAGVDINSRAIEKDTNHETTAIISEALGRKGTTAKALHHRAGNWDDALIKAGFDLKLIRKRFYWTPEQEARIPAAIKALYEAGVDINSKAIQTDISPQTTAIISEVLARKNTRGYALYGKVGNWDVALMAAGLDPDEIRKQTAWTPEQKARIPQAIRALYDAGMDVNAAALQNNTDVDTTVVISEALERNGTTGIALYKKAGNWDRALTLAGFNPDKIRKRTEWTPEQEAKIPMAIKALYDHGLEVNALAISNDTDARASDIISKVLGRNGTTGKDLYCKVNSWDDALRVAGLDPDEIRKQTAWTPEQEARIPQAIRALYDAGIDVNVNAMLHGISPETTDIISSVIGRRRVTTIALYSRVVNSKYANWDDALRSAGLDPEEIKKYFLWTTDQDVQIPVAVKALYDAGNDVNSAALQSNASIVTTAITSKALDRDGTTTRALIQRAAKIYENWDDVLRAAGLDPDEIRKQTAWTPEQEARIPQAIRALYDADIDVNVGDLQYNADPTTTTIISRILNRNGTTANALIQVSRKIYENWDDVLRAAGLDPDEIRKQTAWTPEQEARIPQAIRALYDAGIDVSLRAIRDNSSPEVITIISETIGRKGITSRSFCDKARNWSNALIAAGLDPDEIKKPTGTFGKKSWWRGRYYPSMLARDTAVILSVTGIIPESDIRRGETWERAF